MTLHEYNVILSEEGKGDVRKGGYIYFQKKILGDPI